MKLRVIRNEADYDAAAKRLYELAFEGSEPIEIGSEKGDEAEILAMLIDKYQRENYPVKPPDPIDAIRFRMEQMDLRQKDIAPLFGGKTRVSEVLNRKRPLSVRMIILLNRYLGIPIESLISENQSVKLDPSELEQLYAVPAIRNYLRSAVNTKVRI